MADINIERKGSPVWPWIIGLLVLAVVVWVIVQNFQTPADTAETPADSASVEQTEPVYAPAPPPAAVDTTGGQQPVPPPAQ